MLFKTQAGLVLRLPFPVPCLPFTVLVHSNLSRLSIWVFGQDGWILAKLFFARSGGPRRSQGPQTRKKRAANIQPCYMASSAREWAT